MVCPQDVKWAVEDVPKLNWGLKISNGLSWAVLNMSFGLPSGCYMRWRPDARSVNNFGKIKKLHWTIENHCFRKTTLDKLCWRSCMLQKSNVMALNSKQRR